MKTVSELFKESLLIYKNYFALLAGYAAWLLLPYAGLVLISLLQGSALLYVISLFFSLAQGLLALWLGVFIPLLVHELVTDKKKIPFSVLQSKAWQIIPSVVFVAIMEIAVFLGGFFFFIIPGIIFWVWFSMAQMSVILKGKKGIEALTYSRELARGKFWPLLWRLIAGPLTALMTVVLVTGFLIFILTLFGISSESLLGENPPLWLEIIYTVIETFFMPLLLIYFTLLFVDLDSVKAEQCSAPTKNDSNIR